MSFGAVIVSCRLVEAADNKVKECNMSRKNARSLWLLENYQMFGSERSSLKAEVR